MWMKIRHKNFFHSQEIAPYIFVLPFIISVIIFFIYPVIDIFRLSFYKTEGIGLSRYIGLENYKNLLSDGHFLTALWNNTRYTFWTLVVLIPLPIIVAVFLNNKNIPLRTLFRSALFIPALTSIVVAGVIFRLIFADTDTALMNQVMHLFGLKTQKWLFGRHTAMLVMVLVATWRWLGVNVVYFLSGLQSIPDELYEAAEIDGANSLQKFIKITLPMLRPVTIYVLTISIYGGYAMFAESYIFWQNHSPGDIGLTIVGYLYSQCFEMFNLGYGAAIGVCLILLVFIINIIQLRVFGLFREE